MSESRTEVDAATFGILSFIIFRESCSKLSRCPDPEATKLVVSEKCSFTLSFPKTAIEDGKSRTSTVDIRERPHRSHPIPTQLTALKLSVVKTKHDMKHTLETMPLDIKHEIFSHLLLGTSLEGASSGEPPFGRYSWQTAILRAHKRTHLESKEYLYIKNTLVTVASPDPRTLGRLINDDWPPVASRKAGTFKHRRLPVMINHSGMSWSSHEECPSTLRHS